MTVVSIDTRRRDKLGGSEAAAACGVDPWRSPLMLWFEKLNGIDTEDNEAMALGRALQPAVAELVTERGFEIMPAPEDGFVHPDRPWMVVHPDGLCEIDGERGIAEIKTRGVGWSQDDDKALFAYTMQVWHGMEVTGLNAGLLAILHGGHGGLRLETLTILRNDKYMALMVEREEKFMEALRTETAPAPDGSKSSGDAINLMHPTARESSRRAIGELWQDVRLARELGAQGDEIHRQYKEVTQRIKLGMGEATELYSPFDDLVATWRETLTHRFDSRAFAAAHPKMHSTYNTAIQGRRFLLK